MNDDLPNESKLVVMVLLLSQLDSLTANQIILLKSDLIKTICKGSSSIFLHLNVDT